MDPYFIIAIVIYVSTIIFDLTRVIIQFRKDYESAVINNYPPLDEISIFKTFNELTNDIAIIGYEILRIIGSYLWFLTIPMLLAILVIMGISKLLKLLEKHLKNCIHKKHPEKFI